MDSNIDQKTKEDKPLEFTFGTPRLIVGLEAVLREMCTGEKLRAKIPGPLAYNTRAGFLPYDTAVLYEVELVSVTRGDGTVPTEAPQLKMESSKGPVSGDNWLLALVLVFLLAMVAAGAFFLRSSEKKVTTKESKKESKKDKKKR